MSSIAGHVPSLAGHPAHPGLVDRARVVPTARRAAGAVAATVLAALCASSTTALDDAGVLRTAVRQAQAGRGR